MTRKNHRTNSHDVLVLFSSHPSAVLPYLATLSDGRRVAIAHTTAAAREARTMVDYLRRSRRFGGLHFTLFDIGECYDFADCIERLDALPMAVPYELHYTAGTRVASASAVWKHLDDHGNTQHHLRSYLDNWTGKILLDGQDSSGADFKSVPGENCVEDLIGALGYQATSDFGPLRLVNPDTAQVMSDLERLRKAVVAWRSDSKNLRRNVRDAMVAAARNFTGYNADYLDSDDVGRAGEVLAGGIIALAVDAAVGDEDYEILGGVTINEVSGFSEPQLLSAVAEFDVVLCLNQRIIHFEAKRADYNARGLFVERDALGRFVFGSESRMWTVTFRETNERLTEEMEELEELGRVDGTQRDRYRFNSVTNRKEMETLIAEITAVVEAINPRRENILPESTVDSPHFGNTDVDALICSLGVPSSVQAIAGELGAIRLGCFSSVSFGFPLPNDAVAVPFVTQKMHAITAYAAAKMIAPPVLAITTGPKSVSSGFVRYAYERVKAGDTQVELLQVDRNAKQMPDGSFSRCVRRGNPAKGWSVTPRKYEEQFEALSSSGDFLQATPKQIKLYPRLLRSIAGEATARGIEVWVPAASKNGRMSGLGGKFEPDVTIDLVVLTGRHTTGVVAVVDQDYKAIQGKRPMTSEITWARKRIIEEEAKVEHLFNGRNRVLVCIPPHFDAVSTDGEDNTVRRSSWDAVEVGNDWEDLVHFTYPLGDGNAAVKVPEEFWQQLA